MGGLRGCLTLAYCLGMILFSAMGGAAEGADKQLHDINIPRLNAAEAINQLAEQSGSILLFPYDITKTRQANPVVGRYTVIDALERLLEGSGLVCGLSEKGVIKISLDKEHDNDEERTVNLNKNDVKKAAAKTTFLAGILSLFAPVPGSAQGTASSSGGLLEEIVVTAQKREQNIQDIAISITAFSGEQMDALGITDTTEITQQVPGLQLNAWSPNLTIFNLRGISQNNFQDNLEAPIAVYNDDAYIGSINGLSGQLFDVERLEVLRGPQGTLFGRNATGGLIHYVSRDASEDEFNAYIEGEYGNYDRYGVEFAAGGGITDKVRARVAGRVAEADGYIKSVDALPGVFAGSGQDIGGVDAVSVRGTLQVDFSEQLQGNFWIKYAEDKEVATGGYVFENCNFDMNGFCPVDAQGRAITTGGVVNGITLAPSSVHEHFNERAGTLDRQTISLTGKLDYELDNGMEFVSITNYMYLNKNYSEDGDALPLPIVNFDTFVDYTQWSQELRLSGETEKMRWQTGFYYLDIELDGGSAVGGAPGFGNIIASGRILAAGGVDTALATAFPGNGFENAVAAQEYLQNAKNWSIFGQVEYDLSDKLMLTAGLRWSQDDKDIDWRVIFTDNFNGPTVITSSGALAAASPDIDEIDYNDWAGRIALDYQMTDTTMVFASVNRGIKGGGWSNGIGANITTATFQHKEEVLWSYEVGFKSDFNTVRLNGTFYYYDYSDYQAFSLAGGAPLVSNSDARAFGGELELFWSPNENWDVVLGGAYSDSKVDAIFGANSVVGGGGLGVANIIDAEFPNAPSYSGNYLVRYNWNMAGGNVAIQIDGAFYDDQFLEVTNGSGTVQESYNVSNARLTYTPDSERFSVTGWVKNFTDEEYKVYSLDLGDLGATTYYAAPITYGITARVNW